MIRRTVAKAFGLAGDERPRMEKALPEAGGKSSRVSIINGFFVELQDAFERAAREAVAGAGAPPARQVSKTRPRPDGLEFVIEGPPRSYRLLNSMDGIVRIFREEAGRFREEKLLTILFEGGRPRPIEKLAGGMRAPFRFTSIPRLVKDLLEVEAGGRP
jgi:hypothetical protein